MTAEILAATEHLVLRRMTNDAAAALAAYRSDPVQAHYQSWETPHIGLYVLVGDSRSTRARNSALAPLGRGAETTWTDATNPASGRRNLPSVR
jgi:hypothetical protein